MAKAIELEDIIGAISDLGDMVSDRFIAMQADIDMLKSDVNGIKYQINDIKQDIFSIKIILKDHDKRLDRVEGGIVAINRDIVELYGLKR